MSTESTEIKAENGSKVLENAENVLKMATETNEIKSELDSKVLEQTENGTKKAEWPWRKAKKVAVLVSFVGKDYLGMQR